MSNYHIVGLGEVLWDLFPEGRQLGGAPANFAYHAHALGAKSHLVSRVGKDKLGDEIINRLHRLGITTELVSRDSDHPTGTVEIELDINGKPAYQIHEDAAWDHIPYSKAASALATRTDAVCFGSLGSRNPVSRASIKRFLDDMPDNSLRVYDVNLRQHYYSKSLIESLLTRANVFKLSDEELPVVAGLFGLDNREEAFLQAVTEIFKLEFIALTKGADGSLIYKKGETSMQSALPGEVVDSVGAGDSFTAALIMGLLKGWELDRVNLAANRVATVVVGQNGATPDLPEAIKAEFTDTDFRQL